MFILLHKAQKSQEEALIKIKHIRLIERENGVTRVYTKHFEGIRVMESVEEIQRLIYKNIAT